MKAVKFKEANIQLAEDQPEYETLPIYMPGKNGVIDDPEGHATFCMRLTKEEVREIVATHKIWITQLTFNNPFQPICMTTKNPFIQEPC
jgi:hypothetical protein